MFLAYRFARKKYQERQAKQQATQLPSQRDHGSAHVPSEANIKSNDARPDAVVVSSSAAPHTSTLTPEEKAENRRRRSYRWKVVFGLFAPFTLQALDTTIVAAALPTIAVEFSEANPPPFPQPRKNPYFVHSH